MKLDMYAVTSLLIGALIAGATLGALVTALGARVRQLDDGERAGAAYRELRDVALHCANPPDVAKLMRDAADIWDRWRPDGLHLDAFYRRPAGAERTPAYVHRIVDAYATGDPADLSGCWVPPDVHGRLRAILISAGEATAALPDWPRQVRRDLIVRADAADLIEATPVRAGAGDG